MEFRYSKQNCNLKQLLSLEWLITNGLGGYSSSTILGCHTRKYHGLLVSKLAKLPDKYVLLSKFDDTLIFPNVSDPGNSEQKQECSLSSHQYVDCLLSDAYAHFQEFIYDTHPQIIYQISNDVFLTKEILLVNYDNTVLVKYKLVGSKNAKIKVRPLFAYRNFHALTRENPSLKTAVWQQHASYRFSPYPGMPDFFLTTTLPSAASATVVQDAAWYRNFSYELENKRGYEASEDLFSPCIIELSFIDSSEAIIAGSLHELNNDLNLPDLWEREIRQRKELLRKVKSSGAPLQQHLKQVARSFLQVNLDSGAESVVSGYHWFLEWGRDAMISLPGLTLYSGLENRCLAILKTFAQHEKDGLIPNFIGSDHETNAYNSVDASLWFAWAVQQYYAKTRDLSNITAILWPALKNIFKHYKNGTAYNIKMQEDSGLLFAGAADTNLTWMDAMVNGKPVTARYGMQVEVNALWFNLLNFVYELATVMEDPIKNDVAQLLPKIRLSFCKTFYDEKLGYLYDFVNAEEKNASLRPNQIFAVSLPYSPLPKKIALKVVESVREHLLTPYGLRTLSPQDANYCGVYEGNQERRDRAYHNGTVWPWLLGHFGEALLKTNDRRYAAKVLQPCFAALKEHLVVGGVGTVAEVFSGDAPHEAGGCISQAWSVAEFLRLTCLLNANVS